MQSGRFFAGEIVIVVSRAAMKKHGPLSEKD